MIRYLMKAVEFADGTPCPHAGQFLRDFDFEYHDGLGFGHFTHLRRRAKKFDSKEQLFEFWKQQPKCRPLRSDGEPNRPLTCLTVTIEPLIEEL
jgi:hypothetical protein